MGLYSSYTYWLYSAHIDRYIYSYYGYLINEKYNQMAIKEGINDVAIAYRTNLGLNNINFAKRAIDKIRESENCYIIVGDFTSFFDNLDQPMIIDMGGSMGVSLDEYIDPFLEEFEQQNSDKYAEYFKRRDVIGFDKIYNLLKPFKNVFSMKLPDNYHQTMLKASSSKLNNSFTVTDQYDTSAKHQIHLGGLINGKFLDLLRLEQIKNTIINFITPQSSTFATELKK